ncbi:hypothetical protein CPHO_01520 [Corynebacterium phocae]|uniref:Uncharacterized protein n=1 Tax=Corynebacterium phocae TaxID=161895 RepID=A0A1L7D6H9_9CORY|nr:hypothetical protein CPHO_01520 [Corynebacterium phocae]KAA8727971.1 hypothetical protein F4V58_01050 [Corynebacterium phocae]
MLRPSKHSHPDRTVLFVAYLILAMLKKQRVVDYTALLRAVKGKVKGGEFLFVPALDFLYLLGLVEYLKKTDSFEYVGP